MFAKIILKLKPFTVPNFVIVEEQPKERSEGFQEGRKFALKELDFETLEMLCLEFRKEVFEKAGITLPELKKYEQQLEKYKRELQQKD